MVIQGDFLLISEKEDSSWLSVVAAALAPFGRLQIAPSKQALDLIQQQAQRMVILDAADVEDPSTLIAHIRTIRPGSCVVVATASPTWRRARDAFQAGATDYIRKSLSTEELRQAFVEALNKTPPS